MCVYLRNSTAKSNRTRGSKSKKFFVTNPAFLHAAPLSSAQLRGFLRREAPNFPWVIKTKHTDIRDYKDTRNSTQTLYHNLTKIGKFR
jgi:gas vesicle protein